MHGENKYWSLTICDSHLYRQLYIIVPPYKMRLQGVCYGCFSLMFHFSWKLTLFTAHQFDFVNWFYWAMWWQQCSYYIPPTFWMQQQPTSFLPSQANMGFPHGTTEYPMANRNSTAIPRIGIQIGVLSGKYYDVWRYGLAVRLVCTGMSLT